jgi:hypothetical protein
VARGFAVFTDNHVQQAVVDGLLAAGWDVVRAIDVCPERTADAVLLEPAAKEGRVFVTNGAGLDEAGDRTAGAERPAEATASRRPRQERAERSPAGCVAAAGPLRM